MMVTFQLTHLTIRQNLLYQVDHHYSNLKDSINTFMLTSTKFGLDLLLQNDQHLGPLHTQVKGRDHVIMRAFDSNHVPII
jgi:hypothetical protein